jgi:hypothetical protein
MREVGPEEWVQTVPSPTIVPASLMALATKGSVVASPEGDQRL